LSGAHTHVVVLPQARLESILEAALESRASRSWVERVQGRRGGPKVKQHRKLDKVSTGYPIAHTEVVVDKMFEAEASYVVAAAATIRS